MKNTSRPNGRGSPHGCPQLGDPEGRPYRNHRGRIFLALVILILLVLITSQTIARASAQTGGAYDLTWNTMDGGGYMFSTGGSYLLGGTIGQLDAAMVSGGSYTLSGGFWIDIGGSRIYLPLIIR